jgi:hypothetical protein
MTEYDELHDGPIILDAEASARLDEIKAMPRKLLPEPSLPIDEDESLRESS